LKSLPSRARISLRISILQAENPQRCDELLHLVEEYRDTLDEVAFFTGEIHPPLPLAVIEERAEMLARVMPRFKALGVATGINHLSTMGHLDEYLYYGLDEPWQHLVDSYGTVTEGSYCPRDPRMRDYVDKSYRALARAKPDFIWIDDDVRMGSHPPADHTCFCPRCLEAFAQRTGRDWDRETLCAAFNAGATSDRLALRGQWIAHNRATIQELFELIRESVDSVDPELSLGWMMCDLWYEGFDYDNWFQALAGPQDVAVKARPGSGVYTDEVPVEMLAKAHQIGGEIALLPPHITDIQSEHENFPYLKLRKSEHAFATEIGLYIAAGCTGCALNLMGLPDPFEEFLPYFAKVREWRAFYDAEVATFGRSDCEGIWAARSKDLYAVRGIDSNWFQGHFGPGAHGVMRELGEIGLPSAYRREASTVTLLAGDTCLVLTRDELLDILAGGVLLDGEAVARLHQLGLGEYAGFAVAQTQTTDTSELLAHHPLNGRFGGWQRDTRPSFWRRLTYTFEPLDSTAEPICDIVDIRRRYQGIGAGLYENSLGGRVIAMGYSPFSMIHTLAKTSQLKTLTRWLSRDRLPAYVSSFHKAALWCRRDHEGRLAMLVINITLDRVSGMRLAVNVEQDWSALRTDGTSSPVSAVDRDGAYTVLELPEMGPWEMLLVR